MTAVHDMLLTACTLLQIIDLQDAISNAQLVLPGAASDGSNLVFRSGANAANSCRNLQFRLLLGREATAGRYPAYVLLPGLQRILQPPMQLVVESLPMLSMQSRFINVRADQTAFSVAVKLDRPAGEQGVTVQLQLLGSGAARVRPHACPQAEQELLSMMHQ